MVFDRSLFFDSLQAGVCMSVLQSSKRSSCAVLQSKRLTYRALQGNAVFAESANWHVVSPGKDKT